VAKIAQRWFLEAGDDGVVLAGLQANDRESILRELLSDEASRSVQLSFERVFASLDAELQSVEQVAPEIFVSLPGAARALSGD
jgi:hypothetical protein